LNDDCLFVTMILWYVQKRRQAAPIFFEARCGLGNVWFGV
jgi:hypothetical protein